MIVTCLLVIFFYSAIAFPNLKSSPSSVMPSTGMPVSGIPSSVPSSSNPTSLAKLSIDSYNGLQSIYISLKGDQWKWKPVETFGSKWEFSNYTYHDPCLNKWQGVGCRVERDGSFSLVSLKLSEYNLQGSLPSEIFVTGFSSLEIMNFTNNSISGSIPISVGSMTSIKTFLMSFNSLSGALEPIQTLNFLEEIRLVSNMLTGQIPSGLWLVTTLKAIYLDSNFLTGTSFPLNSSALSSLNSLRLIRLQNNDLSGCLPNNLGDLSSLTYLSVANNALNGSIPSSIGRLERLQFLFLSQNYIRGTIPSTIGDLFDLQSLILNSNDLSGSIPSSLGGLRSLSLLYLYDNYLRNTIPSSLGNLSNVKRILLGNNTLTGRYLLLFVHSYQYI